MTLPATQPTSTEQNLRFKFGKNWGSFLRVLDDERIAEAQRSLKEMLGLSDLRGRSFLDVGSGSGLFSLAANLLGASRVHSFDYDPDSVACTRELKRRYYSDSTTWTIEQGSVLDTSYLHSLGRFDVVYSWGVLHHTGDMWKGLGNITELVTTAGRLFIAIYNDQGSTSRRWRAIKRLYNRGPAPVRAVLLLCVASYWTGRGMLARLARLENPLRLPKWEEKKKDRGMSVWHDLVDWVGGYPFQVAKAEEVFEFCHSRGFALWRLKTVGGGHGNNEFVFVRRAP
jgi:SAM-dependent methyltransferase